MSHDKEKKETSLDETNTKKDEKEKVNKEVEKLKAKLEKVLAEKDELMDKAKEWENKYYTAYADMANTRKAVNKENEEFKKYAISSVIQEIIPVLDSFDMALKNEPTDEKVKNYVAGFKMIHSKLLNSLKQLGVIIIDPKVGDPYDPHSMEAFSTIEGEEDNLIADIYTKGYKLYDHLLRPSGVIITTKRQEVQEEKVEEEEEKKENSDTEIEQTEESQNTSETENKEEK